MFKKEKLLTSLVVVTLMVLVLGSMSSFATELTATNSTQNKVTITATSGSKNNTTNKNSATISGTVNAVNNASNKTNTNTNKTNTSNYNNTTTNSSKLPYAGTNSSVVFIVLGFAASAIYAYKKVSDYNV